MERAPAFSTADLHDAQPDAVAVVELQFRCFGRRTCFHGAVETLRVFDDHSAVRDTVATDGEGRVLVVDGGGRLRFGLLGDRIATRAIAQGWAGIVIVGAVRDSETLDTLDLGIRALGTTARRSSIERPGELGVPLHFGAVTCLRGDWLYADRDAVVLSRTPLDLPAIGAT